MDTISNLAVYLRGSIANDVHRVENIEKIEREHPGEAATELQDLKEDLIKNEGTAKEIVKHIKVEKGHHTEDQIRIGTLEDVVFRLDDEIKELKAEKEETKTRLTHMENYLETGQIAFLFENDLAKYIYPHDKKFGSRRIFTNMKTWLEKKKDTPEGSEANKKWNDLKAEFSWSAEHENVFFKLLESRRRFAHPTVNLEVAGSRIPDNFTNQEKKCIEDIVAIAKRVNELM